MLGLKVQLQKLRASDKQSYEAAAGMFVQLAEHYDGRHDYGTKVTEFCCRQAMKYGSALVIVKAAQMIRAFGDAKLAKAEQLLVKRLQLDDILMIARGRSVEHVVALLGWEFPRLPHRPTAQALLHSGGRRKFVVTMYDIQLVLMVMLLVPLAAAQELWQQVVMCHHSQNADKHAMKQLNDVMQILRHQRHMPGMEPLLLYLAYQLSLSEHDYSVEMHVLLLQQDQVAENGFMSRLLEQAQIPDTTISVSDLHSMISQSHTRYSNFVAAEVESAKVTTGVATLAEPQLPSKRMERMMAELQQLHRQEHEQVSNLQLKSQVDVMEREPVINARLTRMLEQLSLLRRPETFV